MVVEAVGRITAEMWPRLRGWRLGSARQAGLGCCDPTRARVTTIWPVIGGVGLR